MSVLSVLLALQFEERRKKKNSAGIKKAEKKNNNRKSTHVRTKARVCVHVQRNKIWNNDF